MALVLSVEDQEIIRIGDARVRVYRDPKGKLKVAIQAPKDVLVTRENGDLMRCGQGEAHEWA